MYAKNNYVYRSLTAATIEDLYHQRDQKTQHNYEKTHGDCSRFIIGVAPETARKHAIAGAKVTDAELPDYIYAMYQTLGVFHELSKHGLPMPNKGKLTIEHFIDYLMRAKENRDAVKKAAERSVAKTSTRHPVKPASDEKHPRTSPTPEKGAEGLREVVEKVPERQL